MIAISRNIPETSTSDKFIYTCLFLYADTISRKTDTMGIDELDIAPLPAVAQDFIQTFYGVSSGLRHLITKSIVDGDYVSGTVDPIPYHYLCLDTYDEAVCNRVSDSILTVNKLFVTQSKIIKNNKNTYSLPEQESEAWLWDDGTPIDWDTGIKVGTE